MRLAGATPEQAFFVRTSAAREQGDGRDVAVALRIGFAPRAPNEFLIYDFRYHAASLTTEVWPCATPSGTWASRARSRRRPASR